MGGLPAWSEHRFLSFDKTAIFYQRLTPSSKPSATFILVHGLSEHGGRYCFVAETLAQWGVQVFVPDLRGFGRSGGRRACVRAFSDYHEDLLALHRVALCEQKNTPIFLLGHSLGGLIASSYAAFVPHPGLAGLVLSSPCFGIRVKVPFWRRGLGILASCLFPNFTQATGLNPKYLTHDRAIVERYLQDPLVYRGISARLYHEIKRLCRKAGEIAVRIDCPVLLVQAGDDLIVSKKDALSFYERLGDQPKEIEIFDGFYHEVLNEIDRALVLDRIGTWLRRRLPTNSFITLSL